jgi:hypothetical protein
MPKRQIILLSLLACAAALIALLWLFQQPQPPTHTLPDGSKIILRRVSYGTLHQFEVGNPWQRLAARVVPSIFAKKYPTLRFSDTNNPTLMLWFEHVGAKPSTNYTYGGNPHYTDPPDWQGLFDDSGTDFEIYYPEVSAQTTGRVVQGFRFGALPTSSRQLHFRHVIADSASAWNNIAVFTFDNPAYRPQPTNHTTYPITSQQGNTTIILKNFHPKKQRENRVKEMELQFDTFENGKRDPTLELHEIAVFDPNGGQYRPGSWGWSRPKKNRYDMEFDGGLSTNSLWKLRFSLWHENFLTNEYITITNLSIPPASKTSVELARIPFNDTTLVLHREPGFPNLTVNITALIPNAEENYFLRLIEAPMVNRKPFDWSRKLDHNSQSDAHLGFGFPPGTTNIDLKFGLTKKHIIETTAQPTAR